MQKPFVLLDRDGTLIVERNYLSQPSQVELIPGVADALRELQQHGVGLVVVTNQSGVGRGYFAGTDVERVHTHIAELLASREVRLDGFYVCPHTPGDRCDCRKPKPGLAEQASRDHGFDPRDSFVVGDKACDIDLGHNIGATTILVRTGYGREFVAEGADPHHVVDDLRSAAQVIASALQTRSGARR